jgi:hypothetical protein
VTDDFLAGVLRMAVRRRSGFRSLCAAIDLLGMRRMLLTRPEEAASRLNDLQRIPEALLFFPGGDQYRACFVGDSWFIVREVPPDEDWSTVWPDFCGHVFALASFANELEGGLGNPGLRAVAAHGAVSQVFEPDERMHPELNAQLRNWFVLTGADQALVKCDEALRAGQAQGFKHHAFWHERVDEECVFSGSPLSPVPVSEYGRPELYAELFARMLASHIGEARLQLKGA